MIANRFASIVDRFSVLQSSFHDRLAIYAFSAGENVARLISGWSTSAQHLTSNIFFVMPPSRPQVYRFLNL
jgi:hypothetical protein